MQNLIRLATLLLLASGTVAAQEGASGSNPVVVLNTSKGDITLELYRDQAPNTVENFLQYARDGFYNVP